MLHRLLLSEHILEIGSRFEVSPQALDRETLLEGLPAEPLGVLGAAYSVQGVEVDALPVTVRSVPTKMVEIVAQRAAPGLPTWCGSIEDPYGLLGPPRREEPPPNLGSGI